MRLIPKRGKFELQELEDPVLGEDLPKIPRLQSNRDAERLLWAVL